MKRRLTALLLALCLLTGLFTGCGKDNDPAPGVPEPGQEQTAPSGKLAYKTAYYPLQLAEEWNLQHMNGFCYNDGQIFFVGNCMVGKEYMTDPITNEPYLDELGNPVEMTVHESRIFRLDPQTMAVTELGYRPAELEEGMEGSSYLGTLYPGADGSVWVTEHVYSAYYDLPEDFNAETDDAYQYYVDNGTVLTAIRFGSDGQELQRFQLQTPEDSWISEVFYLKDGTVYATDYSNIYIFDQTGALSTTIAAEYGINTMFPLGDSEMGVSVWKEGSGNSLHRIDKAAGTLGEGFELPSNAWYCRAGFGEYPYVYENNGTFYGFDQGKEPEKLFSWLDFDVDSSGLGGSWAFDADGTIYALENVYDQETETNRHNLIIMTPVDPSELPQKQTLTLACMYLDWNIRGDIIAFNKSRDDVRIVVNDYSQYATEEDYNAGIQKLNTEILSGMVPDLFLVDENMPIDIYAAKGVLQDLWPLIDADPELSREDLMEHFFDALSVDGKLYQIADTFSIETVAGLRNVVGEGSWTLQQLQEAYETLPAGASIFGEMDVQENMLFSCLERSSNEFVDWASQQCSFDSPEFIDRLNFVASFPKEFDYDNYDWDSWESDDIRMKTGKQLAVQTTVSGFEQMMNLWYVCGEQPSFVGYPTTTGNGSSFSVYNTLAISSRCANTDAAWQFVRQYLTEEHQTTAYMWNFPTNRHAFEAFAQQWMTPDYALDENGQPMVDEETGEKIRNPKTWYWSGEEEIEIYVMEQAQYDLVMDLYERTGSVSSRNEEINNIIRSECEAFFAGQKTAEETARLIQDRAGLYVFEQG